MISGFHFFNQEGAFDRKYERLETIGEAWWPLTLADKGHSEAVNALIQKCIDPERENRWRSVRDMEAELARIG